MQSSQPASTSSKNPAEHSSIYQKLLPPIRLIIIDFKVEYELHSALNELSNHSIRNQINFIKTQNSNSEEDPNNHNLNIDPQLIQSHHHLINSQRKIKTTTQSHPNHLHNHINLQPIHPIHVHDQNQNQNQTDLNPEIWWLIDFKQDSQECNQDEFKITTNDPKLISVTNSSSNHLLTILDSIINSKGTENQNDYFSITIYYQRKCEAFRALGHILGLTRLVAHYHNDNTKDFNVSKIPKNLDTCLSSTNNDLNDAVKNNPELHIESNQTQQSQGIEVEDKKETAGIHQDPFDRILKYLNSHHQKAHFQSLGIMIDCSRNGVLRVKKVMELIRFIALMGLNLLQLYTEDTYEIKGEPFFGYFRGPYSQYELKEIDDYAHSFGIEVVPCIQTLGHLGQMLQWPRFGGMRDTHEVLLVGTEEVYKFIEKMIVSITKPLRSKKIHIGMDEAHGVSEGRYRQLFGQKDSSLVFTDHLTRVNQICANLDLKPMIWSDMLFCLAAKNNSLGGYYDSCNPATPELVQSIPPEIELVYWDYYHTTSTPYLNKINQHRDLNYKSPTMASGIWTWSRFWTALPFTIETIRASMTAMKNPHSGVKHALTTIWGDEGNECDIWSALPGILFYSEHAYSTISNDNNNTNENENENGNMNMKQNEEINSEILKKKFEGICGGSFDDFVFASKLDDLESDNQLIDDKARFTPNLSKWLMWEEPFFSILSPQYAGYDLETHYGKLSEYLDRAMLGERVKNDLPLNERLKLPTLLAKILALKCHLRDRLVLAYRQNDRVELAALAALSPHSRLSKLRALLDQLWKYHRDLWMSMYKPFGWEVLELRYGGLRARLETMQDRLNEYMQGKIPEIEELETNTELIYPTSGAVLMLDYHRVSRPQYC